MTHEMAAGGSPKRRRQPNKLRRHRFGMPLAVSVIGAASAVALAGSPAQASVNLTVGSSLPVQVRASPTIPTARWRWTKLPDAPLPSRSDSVVAWTGSQLIVWGGASGDHLATLHADGEAFNPHTNSWSVLPAGPLSARVGPASVWTGRDLFVWGGYSDVEFDSPAADGALYDPHSHSWTPLPASPLSARVGATAVWTGHEVIVIGGEKSSRPVDEIFG